jgi:hypothetical protein
MILNILIYLFVVVCYLLYSDFLSTRITLLSLLKLSILFLFLSFSPSTKQLKQYEHEFENMIKSKTHNNILSVLVEHTPDISKSM